MPSPVCACTVFGWAGASFVPEAVVAGRQREGVSFPPPAFSGTKKGAREGALVRFGWEADGYAWENSG